MNNKRPAPETGMAATFACLIEATAPKPGNVHRGADFSDMTFLDLAVSGIAIGPSMQRSGDLSLGETIFQAIKATQEVAGRNTNLGIVLLLAPLCKASGRDHLSAEELRASVGQVLRQLTADDASKTYEAIRLAKPGGLGHVTESDILGSPPIDLIEAMRLAEDRDLIARQYCRDFCTVFEDVYSSLVRELDRGLSLSLSILQSQMEIMAAYPDSLIRRKCGKEVACESAAFAQSVLASGSPDSVAWRRSLADLDFWLRSDGHRRNPGTTADLIAAGLFVGLRTGTIRPPFH